MKKILLQTIAIVASATSLMAAPFVDDGSDTSNFSAFLGGSVSSDGSSISLTRSAATGDAGADWSIDASTHFSLDLADQQYLLNITPSAQIGNGDWEVSILFFNDTTYLTEVNLIVYSDSTSATSNNIADFAIAQSQSTADNYLVRFRVQGEASSGFSFTEVAAVPEPSQYGLLFGLGVITVVSIRRKRLV
jgi:hypothetical protein